MDWRGYSQECHQFLIVWIGWNSYSFYCLRMGLTMIYLIFTNPLSSASNLNIKPLNIRQTSKYTNAVIVYYQWYHKCSCGKIGGIFLPIYSAKFAGKRCQFFVKLIKTSTFRFKVLSASLELFHMNVRFIKTCGNSIFINIPAFGLIFCRF